MSVGWIQPGQTEDLPRGHKEQPRYFHTVGSKIYFYQKGVGSIKAMFIDRVVLAGYLHHHHHHENSSFSMKFVQFFYFTLHYNSILLKCFRVEVVQFPQKFDNITFDNI